MALCQRKPNIMLTEAPNDMFYATLMQDQLRKYISPTITPTHLTYPIIKDTPLDTPSYKHSITPTLLPHYAYDYAVISELLF